MLAIFASNLGFTVLSTIKWFVGFELLSTIAGFVTVSLHQSVWTAVRAYWYDITPLERAMRLVRHVKRSIETARDSATGDKSPLGGIKLQLIERQTKLAESLARAETEAPGGLFTAGVTDTKSQLTKIDEALTLIQAPIDRINAHYAALLEQADKAASLVGDIMVLEQAKENCSLADGEMAEAKRLIVETLTRVRQDTVRLERQIAVLNAEAAAKSWSALTFKDGQDLETLKTWLNQVLPDSPVTPVVSVSDETETAPALAAAPLPVH